MNPYSRFGLVSNTVSAAIVVGTLAIFGPTMFGAIEATAGSGATFWGAIAASVTVLVVFWLALTEAIFPTLFRFNSVRKMVLGKYYIEGTWLQAEKGRDTARMAVIDVQPSGKGFIFSGYALNEDLEIESNTLIEFSKFEWPFMTYKYRNTLSDDGDGQREGVGEIQFEMNTAAARRYNGYLQHVKNGARLKIEGAKLTKGREVRKLRSLEGREEVFGKYWDLFFNRSLRRGAKAETVAAPLEVVKAQPKVETPAQPIEDTIIPRRRATDWVEESARIAQERNSHPARRSSDKLDADIDTPMPKTGTDTASRSGL